MTNRRVKKNVTSWQSCDKMRESAQHLPFDFAKAQGLIKKVIRCKRAIRFLTSENFRTQLNWFQCISRLIFFCHIIVILTFMRAWNKVGGYSNSGIYGSIYFNVIELPFCAGVLGKEPFQEDRSRELGNNVTQSFLNLPQSTPGGEIKQLPKLPEPPSPPEPRNWPIKQMFQPGYPN